jgi:hypothetical protein
MWPIKVVGLPSSGRTSLMRVKVLFANLLVCLALTDAAWAASKSVSVQVSCTIPPVMEISRASLLRKAAEKDTRFQRSEEMCRRAGKAFKLVTLTAI